MRKLFIQEILTNPTDPAPRLIYADWLEERGDDQQTEQLRHEDFNPKNLFTRVCEEYAIPGYYNYHNPGGFGWYSYGGVYGDGDGGGNGWGDGSGGDYDGDGYGDGDYEYGDGDGDNSDNDNTHSDGNGNGNGNGGGDGGVEYHHDICNFGKLTVLGTNQ